MIKSFNWWDDGDLSSAYVGDKGYDLGSRFAITGSATIAPGWSAGYNLTVRRNRHPCGRLTFHLPQYEVNLMKLTTITIMTAGSLLIGGTAVMAQTTNPGALSSGTAPLQSVQPNTGGQGLGYSQPNVGPSPGDTGLNNPTGTISPLPGSSTSGVSGSTGSAPSSSGVSGNSSP